MYLKYMDIEFHDGFIQKRVNVNCQLKEFGVSELVKMSYQVNDDVHGDDDDVQSGVRGDDDDGGQSKRDPTREGIHDDGDGVHDDVLQYEHELWVACNQEPRRLGVEHIQKLRMGCNYRFRKLTAKMSYYGNGGYTPYGQPGYAPPPVYGAPGYMPPTVVVQTDGHHHHGHHHHHGFMHELGHALTDHHHHHHGHHYDHHHHHHHGHH